MQVDQCERSSELRARGGELLEGDVILSPIVEHDGLVNVDEERQITKEAWVDFDFDPSDLTAPDSYR